VDMDDDDDDLEESMEELQVVWNYPLMIPFIDYSQFRGVCLDRIPLSIWKYDESHRRAC
jgi:hypothetical protein